LHFSALSANSTTQRPYLKSLPDLQRSQRSSTTRLALNAKLLALFSAQCQILTLSATLKKESTKGFGFS